MGGFGRTLILLGVVLVVVGLLVTVVGRFTPLGRLPGDIVVRRSNYTFYFPVVTSILLSVVLTLIMWFFQRR
jgi:fumarate reductase subunit D